MYVKCIRTGNSITHRSQLLRILTLFITLVCFFPAIVRTAFAVSPMPNEIGQEQERKWQEKINPTGTIVCTIKIVYLNARNHREDYISSVSVEGSLAKKTVFEKSIAQFEDRLRDEDISEAAIDCRFPSSGQKE